MPASLNFPAKVLCILLLLFSGSCAQQDDGLENYTVASLLQQSTTSTLMARAVMRSGLMPWLSGQGPYVLLLPNDKAFSRLMASLSFGGVEEMPVALLRSIVLQHVWIGSLSMGTLSEGKRVATSQGTTLEVMRYNEQWAFTEVSIFSGRVSQERIFSKVLDYAQVRDGQVYFCDEVLLPLQTAQALQLAYSQTIDVQVRARADLAAFSRLLLLQERALAEPSSRGFTFFVPSDQAVRALLDTATYPLDLLRLLRHHIVYRKRLTGQLQPGDSLRTLAGDTLVVDRSGQRLLIDGVSVVEPDQLASNGVFHVMEGVLLPAPDTRPGLSQWVSQRSDATLMWYLLRRSGVDVLLSAPGTYTLFLPTDQALLAALSVAGHAPETADPVRLASFLRAHLLPQRILMAGIPQGVNTFVTLQGGSVQVARLQQWFKVNTADLLQSDMEAANGVVHRIDQALTDY